MGIVSYAQNREDVRLARVFTEPTGFYIDIGAADPTTHSMTRHFYDRGWHGINVEPRADGFAAIQQARPRDLTLQAVIGGTNGDAPFFEITRREMGELSTSRPDRVPELRKAGHDMVEHRRTSMTLARLCEQHAPSRIDFLSIDVEGSEADVIAGGDWKRWRPRVLVVEALDLTSLTSAHARWEPMLLDAGYIFVVEDGINRFYVPREEAALAETLAKPISWLDRYEPAEYRQEIDRLRTQANAASGSPIATRVLVEAAEQQAASAWAGYDGLREQLARLRQRVEAYERDLAGRGVSLTGGGSGGGSLAGLAGHEGIGPIWLALAARMTRVSRRYPALSTKIKERVVGLNRTVRRIRAR